MFHAGTRTHAHTHAHSHPASQPGPFLPTATLCQLMLNYSWLTCWIRRERTEQKKKKKSASTEMKATVKSSRNPRTSKYQALIVHCLERWFWREKQNRLFSVDWVLRQKHLMTTTKRSGKVVSHYTSSAIHWPIILQIEFWNLWSDLHPKKWHITVFKLLTTWRDWFLLAASFVILNITHRGQSV